MKNLDTFPFAEFPAEFKRVSSEIPLTSNFSPVVSSIFDNYRSLLIGPDHLIFGLAKDCINSVLALLPNDSYITEFEDIALYSLKQARLRTQGKLFNMKNRTLFPMTITEVFALLQISDYCLHVVVMKIEGLPLSSNEITVSKLCKDSIQLLGSLATVAARLWFTPRIDEDGKRMVSEYNAAFGTIYLSKTQDLIEEHITKMREISSYNEEDARDYQSIRGRGKNVQQRKKQLEQSLRESQVVMKILDKPNVHRLLELVHVSLPMIGSVTRITELEFERGHQAMKRAVESSNQHEPQLDAVSAAIFNDWKGRLAMLLGEDDPSISTKRALTRILLGRELIFRRNGVITMEDERKLQNAIGPNILVRRLFQMQDAKVLNSETSVTGSLFWKGADSEQETSRFSNIGDSPFPYSAEGSDIEIRRLSGHYDLLVKRGLFLIQRFNQSCDWNFLRKVFMRHHHSGNSKKETEIRPGDIIQCNSLPWNNLVPVCTSYEEGMGPIDTVLTYFYVLFIYKVDDSNSAVVLPCKESPTISNNRQSVNETPSRLQLTSRKSYLIDYGLNQVKLLNLTRSCQRVLAQHRCGSRCRIAVINGVRNFYHDQHPLTSEFYIRNRSLGFPPRSA